MKKLILLLSGGFIISCAPAPSQKISERFSEIEIKLSRMEQKQTDLEKDIEKTHERIDKLTELIATLRLEIERLKLRLGVEGTTLSKAGKEPISPDATKELPPIPTTGKARGEATLSGEKEKDIPQEDRQEEEVKVETPEEAYKKAIELYSIKKLYEARNAFLNFIKKYPSDKYTDNAFFWIGKVYQELGDTRKAKSVFESLIEKCEEGKLPDCNKVPDTYLMLMKISMDEGNTEEANRYYTLLIEKFPTSDAAVRAREQKVLIGE